MEEQRLEYMEIQEIVTLLKYKFDSNDYEQISEYKEEKKIATLRNVSLGSCPSYMIQKWWGC